MTYITKTVEMPLNRIINHDLEDFLDELSERAIGDYLLMDVSYKVVGNKGDTLLIEVHGDDAMSKDNGPTPDPDEYVVEDE